MKQVIIVNGSPRPSGNCVAIAEAIKAAMPDAEVEVLKVQDGDVNYCRACNACKAFDEPKCVQNDAMAAMIPKIDKCDAFVILSPIYFSQLSAQARTVIDRMYCFFNPGKPGATVTTKPGKKAVIISPCGAPETADFEDYLKKTVVRLGVMGASEFRTMVLGGLNAPGCIKENAEYMEKINECAAWLAE